MHRNVLLHPCSRPVSPNSEIRRADPRTHTPLAVARASTSARWRLQLPPRVPFFARAFPAAGLVDRPGA
jgi:hypothetical protein